MHERHTTRPQAHEQLLVGWIAGGMTTTTRRSQPQQAKPTMTAPPTAATSICSWGGQGCYVRMGRRGGTGTGGHGMARGRQRRPQKRADDRGAGAEAATIGGRQKTRGTTVSAGPCRARVGTRNHPYPSRERWLTGWAGGCLRTRRYFLFIYSLPPPLQ
jgi:hypothetical protein